MKKNLMITGLTVAALTVGILGAGTIYAQAETQTTTNPIVQRIAERFNLNQADVQEVFDTHRTEMQQEHQKLLEEKLNTAVSEGKITEEQKATLLERMNQKHEAIEEFRDLTREERHERMEQKREEFQNWLTENNIDLEELDLGMKFGRGGPKAGWAR